MKVYGMKLMLIGTGLGVISFVISSIEGVRGTNWSVFSSVLMMVALVIFLIGAIRKNRKE
jgi:hypothetical protein